MKPIVVITRTQPDAGMLAARLADCGYDPLVEPMLKIAPTYAPTPHDPICTEGLVVTSAQALRHMNSGVVRGILRDKAVYAVGKRTAAVAAEIGFTNVHDGGGDVRRLGAFMRSRREITPSSRLLHICGRDLARDTRSVLEGVPGKIWDWTVYEAAPAHTFSPDFEAAMRTGRLQAVLLHSARAGTAFAECVQASVRPQDFEGIICLCLSEAVLESLVTLPFGHAYAAQAPDETALLALLKAHVPT